MNGKEITDNERDGKEKGKGRRKDVHEHRKTDIVDVNHKYKTLLL